MRGREGARFLRIRPLGNMLIRRAVVKSFTDFFRDDGLLLAGSLSYFSMMALVPFCLLLITLFGYFLGENYMFLQFFSSKLVSFFPQAAQEIAGELRKLISYKGLGHYTFLLYGIMSYQLFASFEAAINVIFKIKNRRPLLLSLVLSLLIITLILFFVLLSFGATSAVSLLKALRAYFPGLYIGAITRFLVGVVVPLVLVFLVLTMLYIVLPRRKVRVYHALAGALFTAVLLEMAKHLFTLYVGKVAHLGTIYGPLSAFIIFLLWVYYSSCIFLIGAELVHNLGDPGRRQGDRKARE